MSQELTPDERRTGVAAAAFELIATDLLRDQCPLDEDVALLALAFTEAIVAGDSVVLEVALSVIERLRRYCRDETGTGSVDELEGRLWMLEIVCRWGLFFLEREYADARSL